MSIFILLFFIMILFNNKLTKNINVEYMSKNNTTAIKGFFVMMVFFVHTTDYLTFNKTTDWLFVNLPVQMGQMKVLPFLFYSGYGVMASIIKKGESYIKAFGKNRILRLLIQFDIVVLTYYVIGTVLGKQYDWKRVLLSLVAWEELDNSNWYIFIALLTYVFTYLSFLIFKNRKIALGSVFVLSAIQVVLFLKFGWKSNTWYSLTLFYALGMFYCAVKDKLDNILRNNKVWWICTVGSVALFIVAYPYHLIHFVLTEVYYTLFMIIIILVSMRVSFDNKILLWLGENTFLIYILQRIPMNILEAIGVSNKYMFFVVSLIITLLLTLLYQKLFEQIDKKLFQRKRG